MRIIISPAKKMNHDLDGLPPRDLPALLEETERLLAHLRGLSLPELKKLLACSDQLAELNFRRFQTMDLRRRLTPALLAYEGIQYRYMAPGVFSQGALAYVQEHLRILSGFYGVLRPFDGVTPYRLEMQAKLKTGSCKDLYDFWGRSLYDEVMDESRIIINLASKEYSRCIEKYLIPEDRYISCIFGELSGDRIVQKGVYAKMARGEMVRFMASRSIEEPEQLMDFDWSGYGFDKGRSTDTHYVFIRHT